MTTPTEKPATKRVADPELQAVSAIADILAGLDRKAQGRVMRYLVDRYPWPAQEGLQNGSGQPITPSPVS